MNQSRASTATCARVPGSSKRWVARGTTTISHVARHHRPRPTIQVEDDFVISAHDQQRGRVHLGQRLTREIGPAAAGHHRCHLHPRIGGRDQRRARPGAGAEVADGQRRGIGLAGQPAGDVDQPASQQLDVEDVGAVAFLGWGEQVEQQGGQPSPVQHLGHVPIAGAVPAASAAVREHNDPRSVLGDREMPGHHHRSGGRPRLPHRAAAGRPR